MTTAIMQKIWRSPLYLDKAVLIDVEANETPFAVPVGKLRRGGHISFSREARRKKLWIY